MDNVLSKATLLRRDDQVVEEYRPSIFRMEQLAFDGTFALRMDAWAKERTAGRETMPSGRDGLQAMRLIDAIGQAWEEKREVEVPID